MIPDRDGDSQNKQPANKLLARMKELRKETVDHYKYKPSELPVHPPRGGQPR
jgi:hypothetical protein